MSEKPTGDTRRNKDAEEVRHYDPTRPVAFLHIPKTGGISLSEALKTALKPRASFAAFDRCMFGDFEDFESVSDLRRSRILFASSDLPTSLDFLGGHMSFSTISHAYPLAQFITVLREPMSRLISLWLYWRSCTDQFLEPWGKWGHVVRKSRLSLRDFVRDRKTACQTDNLYVRLTLWPHPLVPDGDFIDERHDERLLQEAQSRLEQFCFVDLLENAELTANLQIWLGRVVVLRKLNETENIPESLKSPIANELDSETLALIESRSRLDLRLWATVVAQRMPFIDSRVLRDQALAANLSHYSHLMAL